MERILIVEDDMTLVALIKAMLKQHANPERQVLLAQNVKEAKHLIESENFDKAFIDERLPDGFGTEVGRLLKESQPNCQVWICTAFDRITLSHAEQQLGLKVISKEESLSLILNLIANH
ncbi:MAG: hypothetical protein DRQ10_01210 [Candidatus Hydrothermota bacterium]|nr:MAG: hypothetical protein DRQ10_01210 [Candidatus Hydrothermae bacterium]